MFLCFLGTILPVVRVGHSASVLSPSQAASGLFFSTRVVVVSPWAHAVARFVGDLPPGDDADFEEEDDGGDPFARVAGDPFD